MQPKVIDTATDDLNIARLQLALFRLMLDATHCGIAFTVTLKPELPLAMGNYIMSSDFRVVRK